MIWFFDVDDTLINTAELTGTAAEGIYAVCLKYFSPEIADAIKQEFITYFGLMLTQHQIKDPKEWEAMPEKKKEFDVLFSQLQKHQAHLIEIGHFKKFCREVFIKIACETVGVTADSAFIEEAANGYWTRLTEASIVDPGAIELFKHLNDTHQPIFLVTGSDARLKMHDDGQFDYDPEYSGKFKRERVEALRKKGLDFIDVCVADPEDKPSPEFFKKAFKMAEDHLRHPLDFKECIIVGDGYRADLEIPQQMGFGTVVLYRKGQEGIKQEGPGYISVGNLSTLVDTPFIINT